MSAIGFTPFDWSAAGPHKRVRQPLTYAEYLQNSPVPSADVPIVRTCIELVTPAAEVQRAETVEYAVTIVNVGRAAAHGIVKVSAGPPEALKANVARAIEFTLVPGAELCEHVKIDYVLDAPQFWLEATGEGDAVIGARKLSLRDACWHAPRVTEVADPAAIAGIVASHPGHAIAKEGRLLAEIKLAATERYLLFYGALYEKSLSPNLESPWAGTGFELIVSRPLTPGAPSDTQPGRDQVFIVPGCDGASAAGLRLNAPGPSVSAAPEISTWARPIAGGCVVAACIPWALLGTAVMPDTLSFELIVDVVNPQSGAIWQVEVFDLPWNGWQRLTGCLACGQG